MTTRKDKYIAFLRAIRGDCGSYRDINDPTDPFSGTLTLHFFTVQRRYEVLSADLFQELLERQENNSGVFVLTEDEQMCMEDYIGFLCWKIRMDNNDRDDADEDSDDDNSQTEYLDDIIDRYMTIMGCQSLRQLKSAMIHPYTVFEYGYYIR